MSEAQRCASVMRRYSMGHAPDTIQRGCYDATVKELERQEQKIATQAQEITRLRAHIQDAQNACADIAPLVRAHDPMSFLFGELLLESTVRTVFYVLADKHKKALESVALKEHKHVD